MVVSRTRLESEQKSQRAEKARRLGQRWKQQFRWQDARLVPPEIVELWRTLIAEGKKSVVSTSSAIEPWHRAVMELMACADEACSGLGFLPSVEWRKGDLATECLWQFFLRTQTGKLPLEYAHSLTIQVDPDKVCVMPKALTPGVGCTLRSLSHHVALLPGRGTVRTSWHLAVASAKSTGCRPNGGEALNILAVPFPYAIHGTDFVRAPSPTNPAAGYFELQQRWLEPSSTQSGLEELVHLVENLIDEAQREVGRIHLVVFPEAALTRVLTLKLAEGLATRYPTLEAVISGTIDPIIGQDGLQRFRNNAISVELIDGRIAAELIQHKHHRWRLDRDQIENYGLAHELDPRLDWWENLDVDQRQLSFVLNRRNWVRTVLICEDLARFDPVLPAINAIGPNLVIALLLDGPQLSTRWPARYATVLADDPGSAVLSLTSLGMVERARKRGVDFRRVVGLWKDPSGQTKELELPENHHGLVLTLTLRDSTQWTMDRRSDDGMSTHLTLSGVRSVRTTSKSGWLLRTPTDSPSQRTS